ncbi:MAG: fenitrothion hydrolase, partial [Solirubrobacteraceae bacterium]
SSFIDSPAVLVIAHGIVGRADLPIPEELFAAAAAAVLVVSFLALAAGWSRPRLERVPERPLVRIPLAVEIVLGALGVLTFAVVGYAGLAGTDSQQANLAPTAVYVGFWVGMSFASLLLGDVFRLLSPWRAIGRAAGWVAGQVSRAEARSEPLPYPDRLGHWPAAAGVLGFVICELCWAAGREPGPLAVLMLVYLLVQLVGMGLYGVEAWTRRGDAFGVWFGLLAKLAPIGRADDGRLVLRPPVAGAARMKPLAGTAGLLVIGIGSTGFDGAKEGPLFNGVRNDLQDAFVSIGASKGLGLELGFVAGLLVAIALVGALWWLGTAGMPRAGPGLGRAGVSRRFAHTLIPIAAAYVVAHYFSLLAYNGQDLWRLASDPLGRGSDLFGGADGRIDYSILTATAIWYVQVIALVAGHVAALVLAHDRALVVYGSAGAAIRSQIVMLVLMVCFTCLGLWLLSAALNG